MHSDCEVDIGWKQVSRTWVETMKFPASPKHFKNITCHIFKGTSEVDYFLSFIVEKIETL